MGVVIKMSGLCTEELLRERKPGLESSAYRVGMLGQPKD